MAKTVHRFLTLSAVFLLSCYQSFSQDYVEVCGVKWAKGNLTYDASSLGDEGFQTGWKLADEQWKTVFLGHSSTAESHPIDNSHLDHFNWGVVGDSVLDPTKRSLAPNRLGTVEIMGKVYIDDCVTEYNQADKFDNPNITYGDLAYWASRGRYKLPTVEHYNALIDEASQQYGYYLATPTDSVYGVLFTTPVGQRAVSFSPRAISQAEIDKGLFLPLNGSGRKNANFIGTRGYYASSNSYHIIGNFVVRGEVNLLRVGPEGAYWLAWSTSLGFLMRPVVCAEQGDVNEDGSVDVTDVILMLNRITGLGTGYINTFYGDTDKDGAISVNDVVNLINNIVR